jgi:hypothetical protein
LQYLLLVLQYLEKGIIHNDEANELNINRAVPWYLKKIIISMY